MFVMHVTIRSTEADREGEGSLSRGTFS